MQPANAEMSKSNNGTGSSHETVLRQVRLPDDLDDSLAHLASAQRKSTNELICEILKQAVQQRAPVEHR